MHAHIQARINAIQRGEVPEGYQKTKVGIIPDEWKLKKIKHVAFIDKESLTNETSPDYSFRYISLSDVKNGSINKNLCHYCFNGSPSRARRIVQKGDILMATVRPNLKGFAFIENETKDIIASTGFAVISPKENTCNFYLYQLLFSDVLSRQLDVLLVGSNYPAINSSDVANLKIPIPPLPEQQKIAEILSAWDDTMRLQQELIEQKKTQKRGLMQLLLTGAIRVTEMGKLSPEIVKKRAADIRQGIAPEGYRKTAVGIIPEEWRVDRFSDLFEFDGGFSFSRKQYSEKGICCLHYGDIHKSEKNFIDIEKEENYIPKINIEIASIDKRKLLEDGDIVFVDASEDYEGIGKSVVIFNENKIPFIAGLHTIFARSRKGNKEVYRDYRKFFLMNPSVKKQVCFFATGISVFGISKNNLGKVTIPLPSLAEQQQIAEILTTADKEIELLQAELEHLRAQKTGLMQLLLTGAIRVHEGA